MNTPMSYWEKYSHLLNPLLVREVRQSLRSNLFLSIVSITTVLCILVMTGAVVSPDSNQSSTPLGNALFNIIYSILAFLCCIVLPVMASVRFRNDRQIGEFDLFMVTGISAHKVILGKLQSSVVQSLLILSIAAPFLMICYLLRGISVVDIAGSLLLLVIGSCLVTQFSILIATIPCSKGVGNVLTVLLVMGLFFLAFMILGILAFSSRSGGSFSIMKLTRPEMYIPICFGIVILAGLIHFASVGLLNMGTLNSMLPLKIWTVVSFLLILVQTLLLLWLGEKSGVLAAVELSVLTALAAIQIPGRSVPQRIRIHQSFRNGWKRIFFASFYPGFGGSLLFACLLAVLLIPCTPVFFARTGTEPDIVFFPFFFYSILSIWCFLPGLLLRIFFRRLPAIVISLISLGIPSVISLMLAVANNGDTTIPELLCPLTATGKIIELLNKSGIGNCYLAFLVFWGMAFLSGILAFRRQWKQEEALYAGPENHSA